LGGNHRLHNSSSLKGVNQMKRILVLGLLLGVVFGLWNFIAARLDPLAEDTLSALLVFYGPMFAMWGLVGFVTARRTGRLLDAVKDGATVALVTFAVLTMAVIVRVNLSLEAMPQRLDWQNLVLRFQASGFESLRMYVNYEYVTGAPFKLFVASAIGAVTGLVGGLLGSLGRREMRRISQ